MVRLVRVMNLENGEWCRGERKREEEEGRTEDKKSSQCREITALGDPEPTAEPRSPAVPSSTYLSVGYPTLDRVP